MAGLGWPPTEGLPGDIWLLLLVLRDSPGTFHSLAPVPWSALTVYDSYSVFFFFFNAQYCRDSADSYKRKANEHEVCTEQATEDMIH